MNKIFTITFIIILGFIGCGSSNSDNNLDNKIKLLHSGGTLSLSAIGYSSTNFDPTELFRYAIVSDTDQYISFINDLNSSIQNVILDGDQSKSNEILSSLNIENNFDEFNLLYFSKLYYGGCIDCREILRLENDFTVKIERKIITGGGAGVINVETYLYRVSKDIKKIVLHGVNLDNNATYFKTLNND